MRASPRSPRCRRREKFADLDIYWWEEPTSRDRQETVHEVAHRSPIPVATGEMYDTVGQFYTLAAGGGVNIFQPEPMSLGGIAPSMQVANLALAHGSYIAPHQSGGPVATAVCLQLAAAVPNFLIQEHFDAFNDPWTRDLVTWHPTVDPANGHLSLPDAPGLGIDLNIDAIKAASLRSQRLSQRPRRRLGEAARDGAKRRQAEEPIRRSRGRRSRSRGW